MKQRPNWLKEKGYIHLSPSLQLGENWTFIIRKIKNKKLIAKHAFFPLIHTIILERKYKKGNITKHTTDKRKHTHRHRITNKPIRNIKQRPIHYASHMDALIYGYYADILKTKYELELKQDIVLDKSIIAYRKIETYTNSGKGKANMHFSKECFDEIKKRGINDNVGVLAIDLKKFFSSLDHSYLKEQWAKLIDEISLPPDHYNVFKSCTKFKYILKDDLRVGKKSINGNKKPFDESKLAYIRKTKGFKCFFESNEELRKIIKEGKLPIYNNPFFKEIDNKDPSKFKKRKINIGIPQGLPISAVLANIYLLEFDKKIIAFVHNKLGGFYRRYSDDILIICKQEQIQEIEKFTYDLIKEFKIEISTEKTERFVFKNVNFCKDLYKKRLTCFSINDNGIERKSSLTYLGFEFKGYQVGIKSTNLAKYYRKLISSIRRKARLSKKVSINNPNSKKAVFINQIKKIYNLPLNQIDKEGIEDKKINKQPYRLVFNDKGFYEIKHYKNPKIKKSNYHSYIKRCAETFQDNSFEKQIKKSKTIVHTAMNKHLKD